MGNEKYNPYDYNRYFNLPKSAPEYNPSRILTPRAGMSLVGLENYRRIRKEADEAMRRHRQIVWNERSGDRYKDLRSAWEDSGRIESGFGLSDCRRGNDYNP